MNKNNFVLDIATSKAFLKNMALRNKVKFNKMIKYSYFSPIQVKTSD